MARPRPRAHRRAHDDPPPAQRTRAARRDPAPHPAQDRHRRHVALHHGARVLRRGPRRRRRPHRARPRAGRPGRDHEPHPLRVDAPRFRVLGGRPRPRAHLRDQLDRPGRPRPRRRGRRPHHHRDRVHGGDRARGSRERKPGQHARPLPGLRGHRDPHRRRRGHPARARPRPLRCPHEGRHRHHRLHVGHDGHAQGHGPEPRELHEPVLERPLVDAGDRGGQGLASASLPAPRPRVRALPAGLPDQRQRRARPRLQHQEPAGRPGVVPPELPPGRPARPGEDLQLGGHEGVRPQAQDLPLGGQGRDRLLPGARHKRRPQRVPEDPARVGGQARLPADHPPGGRQRGLHRVGRRAPGDLARPLLSRRRHPRPGGLRPHRDGRPSLGEHASPVQDRHRGTGPATHVLQDQRRGRDPPQGFERLPALPQRPRGHSRLLHRRRLVPHGRPRLAGPRRLRVHHGPREGDHRDGGR